MTCLRCNRNEKYKTFFGGGSGGTKKVEQDKYDSTFTDVSNGCLVKVMPKKKKHILIWYFWIGTKVQCTLCSVIFAQWLVLITWPQPQPAYRV